MRSKSTTWNWIIFFLVPVFLLVTDSTSVAQTNDDLFAPAAQTDPLSKPVFKETAKPKEVAPSSNPGMSETRWRNETIRKALEEPSGLRYDETSWSDIEQELEKEFNFNIMLDQTARDDALTEDEPLTCNLTNLPLKHALRIALREKNTTFVIQNGVLLIISLDYSESPQYFEHSFINVRPLLSQISLLEKDKIGKPRVRHQTQFDKQSGGGGGGGVFRISNQGVANDQAPASNPPVSDGQENKLKPEIPVELITAESLLIDLVQSSVQKDVWLYSGKGLATIKIIGGYVVSNTPSEMADELRDFLTDLNYNLSQN